MLFYPNIVVVQNRVPTRILHTGRNLTFDQNVLIKVTAHIFQKVHVHVLKYEPD